MDTYEKKYKEIVGKIRKAYQYAQTDSTKAVLKEIFPELAESEDEKIRKEIVRFIQMEVEDEIVGNKWLAWLGKQGERQSIWTDNDRIMAFTLLRDVDQMTYISNEGKNERLQWLNSLEDKFNNEK